MPENTENHDLITTAQEAVEPHQLTPGRWLVRDSDSRAHVIDLTADIESDQAAPRRKTDDPNVVDVDAFAGYLAKHGEDATELWGSRDSATIHAVINAHGATHTGWGDHTVTLVLRHTDDWTNWLAHDGELMPQATFAEHIEDHLPNFAQPAAADMLELAQTFQATTKVDFASSQRVQSGETRLNYAEQQQATAGRKGNIAIPDTFKIGIRVYDGIGDAYALTARFRYRITGGTLQLGYRLNRPRDVLQSAFDNVVDNVEQATGRTVWRTP